MTVSVTNITVHLNLIRNHKVMLDRDLATLYGIPTKALRQAVRRNPDHRQGDRLAGPEVLRVHHMEEYDRTS